MTRIVASHQSATSGSNSSPSRCEESTHLLHMVRQVAGAPSMNFAASLAQGSWLAPLDDDDEFEPDHIEVLLEAALRGHHELAYGNFRHVRPDQDDEVLGRW